MSHTDEEQAELLGRLEELFAEERSPVAVAHANGHVMRTRGTSYVPRRALSRSLHVAATAKRSRSTVA